jgi:cell division protein FtsB
MGGYWVSVVGIVCGFGMIGSALGYRYRPHPAWRGLMIAFSVVLLVTSIAAMRQQMHRDDRTAKYAHISAEQEDVHRRIDALQAEISNSKGPVDPAVAKDRRDRLEALQRDLDAIRKESDDLRNSGAAK